MGGGAHETPMKLSETLGPPFRPEKTDRIQENLAKIMEGARVLLVSPEISGHNRGPLICLLSSADPIGALSVAAVSTPSERFAFGDAIAIQRCGFAKTVDVVVEPVFSLHQECGKRCRQALSQYNGTNIVFKGIRQASLGIDELYIAASLCLCVHGPPGLCSAVGKLCHGSTS